jgi:phosphohistidine phosphatase
MKTLVLIRHAKSDWGFDGLEDIDRPLNERGYRDAEAMRQFLVKKIPNIDRIVSSPSVRTYTTAAMFARKYNYDTKQIDLQQGIYHSPMQNYLEAIHQLDNVHQVVLLFGHNPGITDLCGHISDHEFENVATCGIVALQFDIDKWSVVKEQSGKLLFYEFPKQVG